MLFLLTSPNVEMPLQAHSACSFIEAPCIRGLTGTGWQRHTTDVCVEADEEASHR